MTEAGTEAVAPKRVLIVDDGENTANILAMFFQMEGMEAAVAYDGGEACKRVAEFQPDLILMDLRMPRMDGFEAIRQLRERGHSGPVVALTGSDGDQAHRETSEAGFIAHLDKPVAPEDLRALLRSIFPG